MKLLKKVKVILLLLIIIFSQIFYSCLTGNKSIPYRSSYDPETERLKSLNDLTSKIDKLRHNKLFDESIEKSKYGLSIYPEYEDRFKNLIYLAYLSKTNFLIDNSEYRKAIPTLRLTIEHCYNCANKDYSIYYGQLAVLLFEVNRIEESIQVIKMAILYSPDDVGLRILSARYLIQINQIENAVLELQNAINIGAYDKESATYIKIAREELSLLRDHKKASR